MRYLPASSARPLLIYLLLLAGIGSVRADFQSPHGPIAFDCKVCHTTDQWTKIKVDSGFAHDSMTEFPLVGRHKSAACISCHATLVFAEAGGQCASCHTDVHRGQFTTDCSQCHTPHQWNDDAKFRQAHQTTRFPLVGVHATLDCQSCHGTGQYVNLTADCIGCHSEQFAATTEPNHPTAGFSTNCTECHDVTSARWANPKFAHPASFPLAGGHALNNCQACHAQGFANTSAACVSCHESDYTAARNPSHEAGAFPPTCEQCHSTINWRPATFANHHQTAFPLTGAHVLTDCAQCHVGGQYTGTTTACLGCHEADYTGAQNPTHEAGAFAGTCENCHVTDGWRPATFTVHDLTAFALTGAHVTTDCAQCHVGGQYTGTPTDCWSCHEQDYVGVTDPNHVAGEFPHNCVTCHSTDNWTEATLDHNQTAFPLTGAHVATDCAQCHIGGQYTGTPTDCWSCHAADFTEAEGHVQNGYPHDCASCHTTAQWEGATFDHDNSSFPLTGAHIQTTCTQCHSSGIYDGLPTDCWSCHQNDYEGVQDHVANSFPHDCAVCHSTAGWEGASFDHNNSDFPLTGAHVQANCSECHSGGIYNGLPTDCWSCHEADYTGADDHVENNFPHDCAICHNTATWDDATFNHNNSDFPLTGAHVQANCSECHSGGIYNGLPTDCWSCHEADYTGADDHVENNFPHDCAICHNTATWDDATFNHNNSDFPLTGAHVQANCNECHSGGIYDGLPSDCWSCHQEDYNDADDHVSENYPHDCALCHNTTDWDEDAFNHGTTDFPLTGAHVGVACLNCHVGGQFENTPTDCWFCHQIDFNGASPDHNAGYPQECLDCHTTSNWNSTFNHDQQHFPIYSGRHDNAWNQCNECHTTNGNFGTFSCIDCHEHSDQNDVDDEHEDEDVNGYTYTPTSCYACHPDGNEGPNLRRTNSKTVKPGATEVQK